MKYKLQLTKSQGRQNIIWKFKKAQSLNAAHSLNTIVLGGLQSTELAVQKRVF